MDISGEKCNYDEGDLIPQGDQNPHTVEVYPFDEAHKRPMFNFAKG
jgi:hypothetical protein